MRGVAVRAHFIDAVATLPYSEKDFDPFIINGLFKISINNSFFLKASLFYKATNGSDSIASFVIVPADIYLKSLGTIMGGKKKSVAEINQKAFTAGYDFVKD